MIIQRLTPINVFNALTALSGAGICVVTIRAQGQKPGSPLVQSAEIVLDDSADIAAAQAILDAFDPVQEQAAIEAEEKAQAEHAAFLASLTPKMISDIKLELEAATTKIAELEAKVSVAPK